MDIVPFGRTLFESADLDPIYVALSKTLGHSPDALARWLIAYWCFYHAGSASWIAEREGAKFWGAMIAAAENEKPTPTGQRWPRGAERRHFRGEAAVGSVLSLKARYGSRPEAMLLHLRSGSMDVRSVIARAKEHHLFGGWIAFKIADMLDAVCGVPVKQDDLDIFLYDTPRQSILECWKRGQFKAADETAALKRGMYWLQGELRGCRIPHKPKLAPDWFALETVWCKYLSHTHGHYPLYKDIREIREGLEPWVQHSQIAEEFLEHMPVAPRLAGALF